MNKNIFTTLQGQLKGELKLDDLSRSLYATDASVYRKLPVGVAFPKDEEDIQLIVKFAAANAIGLIPRTAGTSLAGQCVGDGLVVDVSRYMTTIVSLDKTQKTVTVQPGVIRDELNTYLEEHHLFFGPNTSTSNRCMIGGMVGNNSSGTTSIQYGVTRDKVIEIKAVLSDGSKATFRELTPDAYKEKMELNSLEGEIYRKVYEELLKEEVQENIKQGFPKKTIHRRNTGYAVDELLYSSLFDTTKSHINMCKLLCGSEGTLAFTTEVTLQLDDIPPAYSAMVVTHYKTLQESLKDVVPVMKHNLHLCEMMDKVILDCTLNNKEQLANRFFVEGDPAALLMLELKAETEDKLNLQIENLLNTIETSGLSYASPILRGDDINKAIVLRKAGLGLLGNMVGDRKAVACIEDTAVALEDLEAFISEFTEIMRQFDQEAVYYAHAGAGELHLRPILNLKRSADVRLFREITTAVAHLTKKYEGSFSGEHGDGIVRAEFIPLMLGQENYELLKKIKGFFDARQIFNPGKIIDAFPMDESLRYEIDREEPEVVTFMDFSDSEGILKAAEKCNGSGDCRKTHLSSGAMCPSYHATKQEKDTTRGRANVLREVLTNSEKVNRFDSSELKEAFSLCLSCKACARECPSNVDVASLKSEFLYQFQESKGYSLRSKLFAYSTKSNALASKLSGISNTLFKGALTAPIIKKVSGIASQRSIPLVSSFNFNMHLKNISKSKPRMGKLVLLIDEFTQYMDTTIGKDAIDLLMGLGYDLEIISLESGRTFISKGFLKQAKSLAEKNIDQLIVYANQGIPVVGIEPSAILTFRDEYKRFNLDTQKTQKISDVSFLVEEFLAKEIEMGRISSDVFTDEKVEVKVHIHCHQKALSNQKVTFDMLNLPKNYKVSIINAGCCGMAGSFGYEKEHYDTSMKIGRLRLFPAIEKANDKVLIAANGTSCRHQILDGTSRIALHPISILKSALRT